jgi:hypothetical protein
MLTTYHQSPHSYIFYCLACPHHLFLKIWLPEGGQKAHSAYRKKPAE